MKNFVRIFSVSAILLVFLMVVTSRVNNKLTVSEELTVNIDTVAFWSYKQDYSTAIVSKQLKQDVLVTIETSKKSVRYVCKFNIDSLEVKGVVMKFEKEPFIKLLYFRYDNKPLEIFDWDEKETRSYTKKESVSEMVFDESVFIIEAALKKIK